MKSDEGKTVAQFTLVPYDEAYAWDYYLPSVVSVVTRIICSALQPVIAGCAPGSGQSPTPMILEKAQTSIIVTDEDKAALYATVKECLQNLDKLESLTEESEDRDSSETENLENEIEAAREKLHTSVLEASRAEGNHVNRHLHYRLAKDKCLEAHRMDLIFDRLPPCLGCDGAIGPHALENGGVIGCQGSSQCKSLAHLACINTRWGGGGTCSICEPASSGSETNSSSSDSEEEEVEEVTASPREDSANSAAPSQEETTRNMWFPPLLAAAAPQDTPPATTTGGIAAKRTTARTKEATTFKTAFKTFNNYQEAKKHCNALIKHQLSSPYNRAAIDAETKHEISEKALSVRNILCTARLLNIF